MTRSPRGNARVRLRRHERRARHRLDTARDEELAVAGDDRMAGADDRGEPRCAEPVDGDTARPTRAARRAARPCARRCGCPRRLVRAAEPASSISSGGTPARSTAARSRARRGRRGARRRARRRSGRPACAPRSGSPREFRLLPEQVRDRCAAALAHVEREVVDVHRDEPIGGLLVDAAPERASRTRAPGRGSRARRRSPHARRRRRRRGARRRGGCRRDRAAAAARRAPPTRRRGRAAWSVRRRRT